MARHRERNPLWRRGLSSGLAGGVWAFNTYYGYPLAKTYGKYRSEKKMWKKRNVFDVNQYWKVNPQAKKFYDLKMRTDPKTAEKLLQKLRATSPIGKRAETIDIFHFNSEGKLRGIDKSKFRAFLNKISVSKRRKIYTALAGVGVAGFTFARNKYKKR